MFAENAKINCLHNFKTKNKLFAMTLMFASILSLMSM